MEKNALILLIQDTRGDGCVSELLERDPVFRLQVVHGVPTAVARISGGGVDLVVFDLSSSTEPEIQKLDGFLDLRTKSPDVPIVVVSDDASDSSGLVMRTVAVGGAHVLTRTQCADELKPLIRALITKRAAPVEFRPHLVTEARKSGVVIAFLGSKGGVGATTLALNVASVLTQWGKVVLTEVPPRCGSLSQYLRPSRLTGDFTQLLGTGDCGDDYARVKDFLWPYENTPGLSVLFGRQNTEEWVEPSPQAVRNIIRHLALAGDYVVVDLSPSCSDVNRAVIEASDSLLLVVGREPLSIESAKLVLQTIRRWNATPPFFGSIIMNRAAYAVPPDLADIEMQFGIPTLGVMPPAPDLCVAAEKAAMPFSVFEPETTLSLGIINLAAALASRSRRTLRAS